MQNQSETKESFKLLVLASMLTVALWFIPFAQWLTYPLRLFVTFVHETGHILATLASLGHVNRMEIYWSGSGVTETVGGAGLFISSAGYLASTLFGAAMLLWLRRARNARPVAWATGIGLLVVTVFFGANLLVWLVGLALGAGLIALGVKAKPRVVHFLMSFLAVQCLLNAFFDLRTLLFISAYDPNIGTDARNMSAATGNFIPPVFWAIGWTIASLGILVATLWVYYRSLRQRAAMAEADPAMLLLLGTQSKVADPLHGSGSGL